MYNSSRLKLSTLVSDNDREIYEIVNYVVVTGSISFLGMVANVVNIMVFYKQGFNNTMNISCFVLAVSDLLGLLTLLCYCQFTNPLIVNVEVPLVVPEIRYLTVAIPYGCFARITGWITVFMTAERCLCITKPLKVKLIITPKRTIIIVFVIYIVIIISFIPEYATCYIDWKFYPERNKTLLGFAFTSDRKSVEGLMFVFYSLLGSASFVTVIAFTMVLVVKLKEKSKWRRKANVDTARSETISARDRKTMIMVVMIATVLIVCYIPGVAVSIVTFFEPEFSFGGNYANMFYILWSFAIIFQSVNSSVNIFLYYNMSSRYREIFHHLISFWKIESACDPKVGE